MIDQDDIRAEAAVGRQPLRAGHANAMRVPLTDAVHAILAQYEGESAATKINLARILMHGRLGGTGRVLILPVDQGLEHGPARSFEINPPAYDPHYHFRVAIDAGLSAFAAPLGMLAAGSTSFAGKLPMILKLNGSNSLSAIKDQAVCATVDDAVRLNCAGVGFTLYPGSDAFLDQAEELRLVSRDARAAGLPLLIWAYPRGGLISSKGETALDVVAYAAHIAVELGAHIVKVKFPDAHVEQDAARSVYSDRDWADPADRIRHVMQSAFAGRRLVIFSGGPSKDLQSLYDEVRAIRDGGGNGSIIGRNCFQRPRAEALAMVDEIVKIYSS